MWINSIFCHYFQKNLKRRRFWATPGATHINRKWTFSTLEPWFWTNFEANRLFKSKTTLSNTNLVVPTCLLKRETGLLLYQPCSKTSLLIRCYWLRMRGLWIGAAFVRDFCIPNGTAKWTQAIILLSTLWFLRMYWWAPGLLVFFNGLDHISNQVIDLIRVSVWSQVFIHFFRNRSFAVSRHN